MTKRVVVVGNGLAGNRFVERLRAEQAADCTITLLGSEARGGYNRVLLSEVLAGSLALAEVFLQSAGWYAAHGVTVRDGVRVCAIDRERCAVGCDDGSWISYDKLVLATGSAPVLPPIRGLRRGDGLLPGCFAFRTVDDCSALIEAAAHAKRAVVVGGGVLGLEAARGLAVRGLAVEVVHRPEFLMNHQLDAEAATVLRRVLHDLGVACYVAAGASAIEGDDRVTGLRLSDRFVLGCDMLVFSSGTKPCTQLATAAGLATGGGIVVDDTLRSVTDPRVLAIGDCAEHRGRVYGLALPALEQAAAAAATVSGRCAPYTGSRPVTRLKAAGIDLAAMGDSCADPHDTREGAAEVVKFVDPVRGNYKKLVIRDGRLAGAIMLGDLGTAGTATLAYDRQAVLPPDRLHLLFGGTGERPLDGDPAALPDDALVCQCNAVPAAAIRLCVAHGACSVAEVAHRTRATTGCGTCRATVAALLTAPGPARPGVRGVAADERGSPRASTASQEKVKPTLPAQATQFLRPRNGAVTDVSQRASNLGTEAAPVEDLLIVGGGMVAHRLVEELARRDASGRFRITVLAEERHPPYNRVELSRYLDGCSAADLSFGSAASYAELGVALRTGVAVTAIDRGSHTVTSSAGETFRYDALVLATGSRPFVPPVPGAEATGCFVYRTIDDLDAIRDYVQGLGRHLGPARWARPAGPGGPSGRGPARSGAAGSGAAGSGAAGSGAAGSGAVIGGGLLGLEAAGALRSLGLNVHVVEMAPRLMPAQVDDEGGRALLGHVTSRGLTVHCGVRTEAVTAVGGRVRRLEIAGSAGLDVDVVVFSAGIRPRDELARTCGLPTGPRGGFLVDAACRTEDPAILAIGECAAVEGTTYGLVAPGYAMAEVAASQLLGGAAVFATPDLSTKLKLLDVDVASFGDAHGASSEAVAVRLDDPAAGVYAKLVVGADGRRLLGGILVGDATAYSLLAPLVGRRLPRPPGELLAGARGGAESAGLSVTDLPAGAFICTCNSVTKGTICGAVADGCQTVADLKKRTRAGTGCGSCVPSIDKLRRAELEATGVPVSNALCEHFPHTRQELYDLVRVRGYGSFGELLAAHGSGRGCEICRPVVASILASRTGGYVLTGEQASLQDTNDHMLANMQRDGTYSVVPRVPGGEITPAKLAALAQVAGDFGLYVKITGGQRIDLLGARVEQLPLIWRRLTDAGFESGHAYGKAFRTMKSCVGTTWCRYGVQDSVSLAIRLEMRYRGLRSPHKIKGAVSGCARECAEAQGKDVGVIATENGWNLYVGGNGGARPQHAKLFALDLDTETLIRYIDRFLLYYVITADRLERTATWLNRLEGGLGHLRRVIVEDSLGMCAEWDAHMQRLADNYECEWRRTLDDPEALRHFVSFVNAPERPDPDIVFVTERDQPRPATAGERKVLVPVLARRGHRVAQGGHRVARGDPRTPDGPDPPPVLPDSPRRWPT